MSEPYRPFDVPMSAPIKSEAQAVAELVAAGLTPAQIEQVRTQVTGMGRRRMGWLCEPDDTILRKYRAGALSVYGVMGEVFGSDSAEHHAGHARGRAGA